MYENIFIYKAQEHTHKHQKMQCRAPPPIAFGRPTQSQALEVGGAYFGRGLRNLLARLIPKSDHVICQQERQIEVATQLRCSFDFHLTTTRMSTVSEQVVCVWEAEGRLHSAGAKLYSPVAQSCNFISGRHLYCYLILVFVSFEFNKNELASRTTSRN